MICNKSSQQAICDDSSSSLSSCESQEQCEWSFSSGNCNLISCSNLSTSSCSSSSDDYSNPNVFNYCQEDNNVCTEIPCKISLSADEINNEIYPWSTYAYLPFLLLLGVLAEGFSYRVAILLGVSGDI